MDEFSWTPRTRLIAIGLAGLLLAAAIVFVGFGNDSGAAEPAPSPGATTAPAGTPSGGTSARPRATTPSVVPRQWPVDPAGADQVARQFAVAFSTYLPTGPGSPKAYLESLRPYASQEVLTNVEKQFDGYWWELTRAGLGTANAKVVSVTTLWSDSSAIGYRVRVDRDIRSYLGQTDRDGKEQVSWDLVVTSPEQNQPKVASCVRTDTRPSSELSDPYAEGEADGE